MKDIVSELFPSSSEDVSTRTKNTRDSVLNIYETGMGLEKFRGTAWGAFNAVTEYADHWKTFKGGESEARASSIWFGSSAALKQKAYDLVSSVVSM